MSLLQKFFNRDKVVKQEDNKDEIIKSLQKEVSNLQKQLKDIDENFLDWYQSQNQINIEKQKQEDTNLTKEQLEDKEYQETLKQFEWKDK